ncbi:MAG: mannonate dehydratase [Kiritimatiellae bacterium]|jgi:mannonate dehydratase|nr:mannonate dehydratase [Kiritimatiellia bacterium]
MKLGMMLPALPDIKWELASQIGVKYAITKAAPELTGKLPPWNFDVLKGISENFADAGFKLYGLEGDEFDMSRIKLGLPGRDEDIEKYHMMLRNMGHLEIPLMCYNFMAGIGWYRTSVNLPERGGALTSGFNMNDVPKDTELIVTEEQMWNNYEYFIKAVLPVAEEAGVKMGLHPDDPPISPLLGYSRIFTSAEAFRKAMALSDSPSHCITFCQATFKTMGENVFEIIPEFAKRIAFLHFRDVRGDKSCFRETFHDNGPTDMAAFLKVCDDSGLDVIIRPDHTPSMAGEDNSNPGYEMQGNLFAVGYMKGLMDALGIKVNA